jgi:high-affinity iron transporter
MCKKLVKANLIICLALAIAMPVFAAFDTWNDVVNDMQTVLESAYTTYTVGDVAKAKELVDVAYYRYYEKLGFEKTVMARISGDRAAKVEYQFSFIKKAMTNGAPNAELKESLDKLLVLLRADANQLDGKSENAFGVFLGSLLIIVREGFEAILVVGAIVAYLHKSGNKKNVIPVYWGAIIALGVSVVMAWALNKLSGASSGQNQEILEGATMLVAVLVLFYVSNWMVSKAESGAWSAYIEGKVQSGISRGSVFSLAFAAFLAVFREGAETILFYQALLANTKTHLDMVWLGIAIGAAALVVIYILIRLLSLRLPLKPFFLGTSILLFAMSIAFAGNGIKELQEGNLVGVTPVPFVQSVSVLGIFPTVETLVPQIILLAVTVATFALQLKKSRARRLIT